MERAVYAFQRLKPFWGDRPVSVVNQQTLRDYEEYRVEFHERRFPNREPISDNTIIRELGVLRAALSSAYRGKLINQEVFIDLPPQSYSEITFFTCKEAVGLLFFAKRAARAKDYLPIFLAIGFLTGRRKSSILELRWEDINLETGIIRWQREGAIETNKRRPVGALPKRLKRILTEHRKKHPDDEYVVSYNGKQIKDIKKSFGDAVHLLRRHLSEKTSTEYDQVLTRAYTHMMRHSCATWLMQKGTDKRETCQFLGMTEDTLDRRYWSHHPDYQKGPANAF